MTISIPSTAAEYRLWWHEQRPGIPYGECWCGCGERTGLARQRDKRLNYFASEPARYARGHGNAKPRISEANYDVTDTGHSTPCWLWNRYLTNHGYGFLYERGTGKPLLAHRQYYEHYVCRIPQKLQIHHLCKQRRCVNPAHMQLVTQSEHNQITHSKK